MIVRQLGGSPTEKSVGQRDLTEIELALTRRILGTADPASCRSSGTTCSAPSSTSIGAGDRASRGAARAAQRPVPRDHHRRPASSDRLSTISLHQHRTAPIADRAGPALSSGHCTATPTAAERRRWPPPRPCAPRSARSRSRSAPRSRPSSCRSRTSSRSSPATCVRFKTFRPPRPGSCCSPTRSRSTARGPGAARTRAPSRCSSTWSCLQ